MEDIRQQKARWREKLLKEAALLEPAYLESSNTAMAKRLMAQEAWQRAQRVFIYVSVGSEPDTRRLIEAAWQSNKEVYVPRCLGGGVMQACKIENFDALGPAPLGLLEPGENAPVLLPRLLDLVVAPCVAADEDCNRLGHGGGYYDRYLQQVGCPVVCLCRGKLLQKQLPHDIYDVPVSLVLTEEGAHTGQKG